MSAPQVGIIMGSASDHEVMRAAADVLADLGIAHEVRVVSAHRTPHEMVAYATSAAVRAGNPLTHQRGSGLTFTSLHLADAKSAAHSR